MTNDFKGEIAEFFTRYRNRKIFDRLDVETLHSIADADVELAIVDFVGTKLRENRELEVQIVRSLAVGVRATYHTWIVEGEVRNGGFNQYYFNTDGKFASDAVSAFEYFGAIELAVLMREANSARALEAKDMEKYRERDTWDAFAESYDRSRLGELDERFYRLYKDLSSLRIARIREIPEEFVGA
jgi:hypothetical protein